MLCRATGRLDSINVATACRMCTRLRVWCITTAQPTSPWRLCGPTVSYSSDFLFRNRIADNTLVDYMYLRRVFTLDPDRFPLHKMRQLVDYLYDHQQHYIVMVDPAVAYQTEDYAPFTNGVEANAFLKNANGSIYQGVVWPGVTEFPDWFAPGTQGYWNGEFDSFFDANTGINIDGLWIDMNEASNFCDYPCTHPEAQAAEMGDPPR